MNEVNMVMLIILSFVCPTQTLKDNRDSEPGPEPEEAMGDTEEMGLSSL